MESSAPQGRRRLGGPAVALAVVLGLLALVAVASRGDTPAGTSDTRRPSHLLIDTLVSLYIVVMAFGAILFVYLFILRKDSAYERARLRREGRMRSVIVFVLFLGAIALALRIAEESRNSAGVRPPTLASPTTSSGDPNAPNGYEPEFALVPVLIVGVLVAGAIVALVVASRRRRHALGPMRDPGLLEALEDVLAESLDDLRSESDPRKAVIAAYARLERTLAAYGLPRSASEAPAEYLARMLTELSVSHRSVGRLTALFERAKFSHHEVDATMKDEAIDALETTRAELAEARERELAERAAALAEARERAAGA